MARKVFVSVPMKDRTDEEIQKDINEAKERYLEECKRKGIDDWIIFLDDQNYSLPDYVTSTIEPDKIPLAYLGHSIEKMAACDDVIFAGDWQFARGCVVERLVYDLYFRH